MMPGRMPGGSGDMDLNSVFEAVGAYKAGKMDDAQLNAVESSACPGCGSVRGHVHGEFHELYYRGDRHGAGGNGTLPRGIFRRLRLAKLTGMKIMELLEKDIRPRDILTEKAFENAFTVDMALGCSTNTVLHIPAIAQEAGVKIDLSMVNEISEKAPNLCHLAPAGHHHVIDLYLAGGVMGVLSELEGPRAA